MTERGEQSQSLSQYGKLLVALSEAGVDYAAADGLAVIFNGHPRLTLDAEITVNDSPANLQRLLNTPANWGEGFARERTLADFTPEEGTVRVAEEFNLDSDSSSTAATTSPFSVPPIAFTASRALSARRISSTSSP